MAREFQCPQWVGSRADIHRSCLPFGNLIVFTEMSSLVEDQVSECIEQHLIGVKKNPRTLSNLSGQLLEKIIRKGKLVLRELDLAVYQM